MKKSYIIIIVVLILSAIGLGIYFYKSNKNKSQGNANFSYNSTRVSASNETNPQNESKQTNSENKLADNSSNNSSEQNQTSINSSNEQNTTTSQPREPVETLISEFTTKIYTKDKERQNNISITCSSLNDTFVENGDTFSFCNTVGKATTSKGYQKADVYQDGEVVQALGGGNCQVSSTLYNAVLKVSDLKVTERHEHSNSVPYVSKGKDAAVAYGSYDFKFVNNTGTKIKISASCDKNNVYTKIFKVE